MVRPIDNDPLAIALAALTATLSDGRRAQRFLELTGIGIDELRARAAQPALLAGLLRFLEAHEPDLVEVAAAAGLKPAQLVRAREQLEEGMQ